MLMQRCKDNSFFLFISRFENQEIVDKLDTYPFFLSINSPKHKGELINMHTTKYRIAC